MILREVNRVGEGQKNVPKLRFKGYEDAWEQWKLTELFVDSGSGGTPKSTNKDFYDGDIPFLSISDIKGRVISDTAKLITQKGLESSAAWLVPKGALSLAMYASVGKIGILNKSMATSQAFFNMVFDNEAYRDFVYTRLEKAELFNEWESYISTGTQRNLNAEKVKRFKIYVPNSQETARIANIFLTIDNYITLHQRKYDALKAMKKTLLSKMFPKDGEDVPEIRFKGFTDAWEQRKLGEIGEIQTGNTPPTVNPKNYSEEGMLWVTPTDIEELVITNTAKRISELGQKKARIASKGSVLVTCIASIGKNTLLKEDAAFNQQINSITPTEEYDSYFLLTQSFNLSKKMVNSAAAATMQIVNKSQFSNFKMTLPIYNEQVKIGELFQYIDNLITLHQRKLDELKNMKKTLLQQMFV